MESDPMTIKDNTSLDAMSGSMLRCHLQSEESRMRLG